jgi:hypothetical protein
VVTTEKDVGEAESIEIFVAAEFTDSDFAPPLPQATKKILGIKTQITL